MRKRGRPKGYKVLVKNRRKLRWWKTILSFQRDAQGMTWEELMDKYNIRSRQTVARWKKLEIPIEILEKIDQRHQDAEKKRWEKRVRNTDEVDINPIDFVEHPRFLNIKLFPMQKLILKAFYSMELTEDEKDKLNKLHEEGKTNWEEGKKYNELALNCGMKSGKTTLAGVITCIEEKELWNKGDPCEYYGFPKGKEIFLINVATNRDQARDTIFASTKSIINNSPFYQSRKPSDTEFTVEFENNIKMRSGHSNSSSLVGLLPKLVLFDEIARFTDSQGRSSGDAVYEALTHSVAPFKGEGKVVSISSPIHTEDKIMTLYRDCFRIDGMLGFWLPTWEMNPNLPFECAFMQKELKKNPEAFWRDFGAKPSQSLEAYYRDPDKIPAMFDKGKAKGMVNPINQDGSFKEFFKGNIEFDYYMHLDPAVNNCGFGLGLAHRVGDRVISDLAYRFRVKEGEIDYERVKEFLLLILERFPTIKKVSYDTYLAVSLYQPLKKKGIEAEFLNVNKEVQDTLKEQVYLDNVETYHNKVLENELKNLELISGKKVDHKKGATKDIADGVAGSVYHCMKEETILPACGGLDSETDTYENENENEDYIYIRRTLI